MKIQVISAFKAVDETGPTPDMSNRLGLFMHVLGKTRVPFNDGKDSPIVRAFNSSRDDLLKPFNDELNKKDPDRVPYHFSFLKEPTEMDGKFGFVTVLDVDLENGPTTSDISEAIKGAPATAESFFTIININRAINTWPRLTAADIKKSSKNSALQNTPRVHEKRKRKTA